MLSKELLNRVEKILVPLGIWPNLWNRGVTILNIFVLLIYSIIVFIKNSLNPEAESIESAFALAFGGVYCIVYSLTILIRKDKIKELFEFIKTDHNLAIKNDEKKVFKNAEEEFGKIFKMYFYFLSSTVIIRILIPLFELGYNKVKNSVQK